MFACACISSVLCEKFRAHVFLLRSLHHVEGSSKEISFHVRILLLKGKLQSKEVALLICSTSFYLSSKKFIHLGFSTDKIIF